ncbi:hypothetical protein GLYMA_17G210600v4 [Glycine max]|uniref:Uncharacterized protein n=1 Tax=Glycine max TaxID=3847 RepID=A0A0R0FG64_SOYBN|nr:hypothetical protein GYH30_047983 [Glycine max]KRH05158.1 hypothetical protein GLYMA_17G210600v4 [Glycine max]
MEPEFWDKNPFKATTKVFPPGFHFRPNATNKTRIFYEFILIDTNSVSIKHFKDTNDPNLNTHSTIQILKVLQPKQFGTNLNQPKNFSAPFDPIGYTYWDYVDAWMNFVKWWDFFGPNSEIYPEQVQQGFDQFKRMFNSQESRIPADMMYFSSFALSWIFSWQYKYGKTESNKQFPSLQRHAFIKLWNQFDTSNVAPDKVKIWFQAHPKFLKATDLETSLFLNKKSQLAAFLASSRSKESLAKNLKEVLQILQQQQEEGSSSNKEDNNSSKEEDPFYQNEDDCFGISINDD